VRSIEITSLTNVGPKGPQLFSPVTVLTLMYIEGEVLCVVLAD